MMARGPPIEGPQQGEREPAAEEAAAEETPSSGVAQEKDPAAGARGRTPASRAWPLASRLAVSTQAKKYEVGIQTLVGDYSECGANHGRKCFRLEQSIPGHEDVQVFLYYWDDRDGQGLAGWWFGDRLGGQQVWARADSHGLMPPRVGWRIPWDSPSPEPGILFCDETRACSATTSPPSVGQAPGCGWPRLPGGFRDKERPLNFELAVDRRTTTAAGGGHEAVQALFGEEDDEEDEGRDLQEGSPSSRNAVPRTALAGWRPRWLPMTLE